MEQDKEKKGLRPVFKVLVVVGLLAVGWSLLTEESGAPEPEPVAGEAAAAVAAERLDFGMTPEEFREAYNQRMADTLGDEVAADLLLEPLGEGVGGWIDQGVDAAGSVVAVEWRPETGMMNGLSVAFSSDGNPGTAVKAVGVLLTAMASASGSNEVAQAALGLLQAEAERHKKPNGIKPEPEPVVVGGYELQSDSMAGVVAFVMLKRVAES